MLAGMGIGMDSTWLNTEVALSSSECAGVDKCGESVCNNQIRSPSIHHDQMRSHTPGDGIHTRRWSISVNIHTYLRTASRVSVRCT